MKFRVTFDVAVEDGKPKVTNYDVVPISDGTPEEPKEEVPQGKQEATKPAPAPARVPTPAPVGQRPSSGKSDWFKGTSWGN
jgi:hypothetical protein